MHQHLDTMAMRLTTATAIINQTPKNDILVLQGDLNAEVGGMQRQTEETYADTVAMLRQNERDLKLSEPEFYGDLVYKFRKIIGKNDLPNHFKKIIVRNKKIGHNINVMRQTACLVVNPIKVNSFAYLLNCTTVGRTSD